MRESDHVFSELLPFREHFLSCSGIHDQLDLVDSGGEAERLLGFR
jgi:hypothetical protein